MQKHTLKFFSILMIFLLLSPTFTSYSEDGDAKEKVVYLTFDDGPGGVVTEKVLDILKSENVPATFFIIGNQIKGQENTILRMKNEGHSLGLHSFSHERSKLYSSTDGFISEMKKVQEALYEVTGENYYILRFPFGCNNCTYKLTNEMVEAVHSNNFKIYDWTQDTLDGANPTSSPDTILNKAISNDDNVVILMHTGAVNKTTPQALTGIIKYYKSKGYKFEKITVDTPEIYKVVTK